MKKFTEALLNFELRNFGNLCIIVLKALRSPAARKINTVEASKPHASFPHTALFVTSAWEA
jgi:hypothetical protein